MDASQLAHSMAALSQATKVPASVKTTAEGLAKRLREKLEVLLISSDPDLVEKVIEHSLTQQLEPLLVFRPHLETSPPISCERSIIIHLLSETDSPLIQRFDGHYAIWSPNMDVTTPDKVAFHSSVGEPDDLLNWIKSVVQSGQDADNATAQFLERKYRRLISKTEVAQTASVPALPTFEGPNIADDDIKGLLKWCVTVFEDIKSNWPQTAPEAATEDLLAAHDQLVLLELEETSAAAQTALCIILQLRLEFEKISGDLPGRHLPNLKLAKTC